MAIFDTSQFGVGTGPIFLDDLRCEPTDVDLLACDSGEPQGLARCSHSQDVGVMCPGIKNYRYLTVYEMHDTC